VERKERALARISVYIAFCSECFLCLFFLNVCVWCLIGLHCVYSSCFFCWRSFFLQIRHADHATLQWLITSCLGCVADHPDGQRRILTAGAPALIKTAMATFRQNSDVQHEGKKTLAKLPGHLMAAALAATATFPQPPQLDDEPASSQSRTPQGEPGTSSSSLTVTHVETTQSVPSESIPLNAPTPAAAAAAAAAADPTPSLSTDVPGQSQAPLPSPSLPPPAALASVSTVPVVRPCFLCGKQGEHVHGYMDRGAVCHTCVALAHDLPPGVSRAMEVALACVYFFFLLHLHCFSRLLSPYHSRRRSLSLMVEP
jgi:hypothetical protein